MRYLLLFGTIALIATGQVLFKFASAESGRWAFLLSPPFIAALVLYAFTTVVWVLTLRYWPMTVAYPTQALAIVLVVIAGVALFGERPGPQQWTGIVTIIVGFLILVTA